MSAIWLVVKEFLTSKKFIAAVAGVLLTLLAKLHFDIPESTVQEIVGLIIAYLLAQGWADQGKEAAKITGTVQLAGGEEPEQPVKDKLL
jgi:hypothetical protein